MKKKKPNRRSKRKRFTLFSLTDWQRHLKIISNDSSFFLLFTIISDQIRAKMLFLFSIHFLSIFSLKFYLIRTASKIVWILTGKRMSRCCWWCRSDCLVESLNTRALCGSTYIGPLRERRGPPMDPEHRLRDLTTIKQGYVHQRCISTSLEIRSFYCWIFDRFYIFNHISFIFLYKLWRLFSLSLFFIESSRL